MANMNPKKTPMPAQEPNIRNTNFDEVALGYTDEMAIEEAKRCLNCKHKPCIAGCPVNVRIPEFIVKIADGDFAGAYEEITKTNTLPAICGRVCPQETQCEQRCVRGIKGEPVAIGRLERFAADWHLKNGTPKLEEVEKNQFKVAVVGAGPASLTCASDLAKMGYSVTVMEAFHTPGGVLVYGIPEFRLPKSVVASEIDSLKSLGVEIQTNMVIGRVLSVDDLFEQGYDAIFLGTGAGLPMFMGIPGENLLGVYSANEYLTRINLMKAYSKEYDTPVAKSDRVAVVGGGNVAMDAARCAKRMGAEVTIVYRRSEAELPARAEEVEHAKEEGIDFQMLTNPVAIHGDDSNRVQSIECVRMELGEPDSSGRRRPIEIKGSNFKIDVDTVIMAIGTSPNPLLHSTTEGLEVNKWGCLITDENGATTRKGVFAGGDAVTGAATVILAMGAGKKAAQAIDDMLQKRSSDASSN
ncbi:MAG: NADPH-dependent glutamate synthase [Christensenellales bacterium]|jgi:glutamate synthase (NADPH/NADH) small chain